MIVLTPEQVAEILQISTRTVYTLLRTAKLPGRKIGGNWRVLEAELEVWMRSNKDK